MSDDEDYNSEEDLDYVPSDGEQVSEEENSGEEEDLSLLQDSEADVKTGSKPRRPTGKKKKAEITARKRKGGIKLDAENQDANDEEKEKDLQKDELKQKKELADQIAKEEVERKQEKDKRRADDLWASFMSDVGKTSAPRSSTQSSGGNGLASLSTMQVKPSTAQSKVTITKVFDFAGEEVKVTEEVDADSKEAKAEKKKQEAAVEKVEPPSISETQTELSQMPTQSSLKRPGTGGLGSVLSKIGKKSKMGTLEKSKIDWESFKSKEGIRDDLKIHNKGKQGYTERVAFLNRTDQRQYELERDLRLGTNSKR